MTVLEDCDTSASRVSEESRLRQAPRISNAWCGDELVLLDASTGRYFTLNHVGGRMWELLATPRSATDLVSCLRREFEVEPATGEAMLRRDIARMLGDMLGAGLLVSENLSPSSGAPTSTPRRHS
jgi:hypothetical protein